MADSIDLTEFSHPFTFLSVGAQEIEQGSPEELQQRVYALMCFQPGDRIELMEYGIPEQAFKRGGADLDLIASAIAYWEPDAAEIIESDSEWLNTAIQTIVIRRDNNA